MADKYRTILWGRKDRVEAGSASRACPPASFPRTLAEAFIDEFGSDNKLSWVCKFASSTSMASGADFPAPTLGEWERARRIRTRDAIEPPVTDLEFSDSEPFVDW